MSTRPAPIVPHAYSINIFFSNIPSLSPYTSSQSSASPSPISWIPPAITTVTSPTPSEQRQPSPTPGTHSTHPTAVAISGKCLADNATSSSEIYPTLSASASSFRKRDASRIDTSESSSSKRQKVYAPENKPNAKGRWPCKCGKTFTTDQICRRHFRSAAIHRDEHVPREDLCCRDCGYQARRRDLLTKHQRRSCPGPLNNTSDIQTSHQDNAPRVVSPRIQQHGELIPPLLDSSSHSSHPPSSFDFTAPLPRYPIPIISRPSANSSDQQYVGFPESPCPEPSQTSLRSYPRSCRPHQLDVPGVDPPMSTATRSIPRETSMNTGKCFGHASRTSLSSFPDGFASSDGLDPARNATAGNQSQSSDGNGFNTAEVQPPCYAPWGGHSYFPPPIHPKAAEGLSRSSSNYSRPRSQVFLQHPHVIPARSYPISAEATTRPYGSAPFSQPMDSPAFQQPERKC